MGKCTFGLARFRDRSHMVNCHLHTSFLSHRLLLMYVRAPAACSGGIRLAKSYVRVFFADARTELAHLAQRVMVCTADYSA